MKEVFNNLVVKMKSVRLTKEQIQVLVIMIVLLLLVIGSGAPSGFSGWGGA